MSTWMPSMEKHPFRSLAHFSFFFFLNKLSSMDSFHVLEMNSLYLHLQTLFFPTHSEDCLFLSFIVYPAAQMLLRLMKSHLLIWLYYSKNESKKNWLRFISRHVLYIFLKSFTVSISRCFIPRLKERKMNWVFCCLSLTEFVVVYSC